MKEKSPALPLAYGQKTESYMVINILAQDSEKNNRIPDQKRRYLDIELFTKEQERVLGDTYKLIQILQFYLL